MKQKEIFNFLMKVAVISWNCFEILTPGLIEVNTTQIRLSKYLLYVRFEILEKNPVLLGSIVTLVLYYILIIVAQSI